MKQEAENVKLFYPTWENPSQAPSKGGVDPLEQF